MKRNIVKYLSKKIRLERGKQKLSQEKLAELAGLHRNHIGLIERRERVPNIENVYKIADALGITIGDLFKGFDKKRKKSESN